MHRTLFASWFALACLGATHAHAAVTATEMVPMTDGAKLATDVYLPAQGGPWPVLLARTPYDKDGMTQTGNDIQKSNLAAAVIQDTRGRFHSEGTDCIFACDADDGADTIAWIVSQPWCNGKIMTHGGSALGIVQYMLAPKNAAGLVGMIVDVATPDLYDFMFPGGVFRQHDVEGWLAGQGSTFWLDNIKQHPFLDAHWEPVTASRRFGEVNVPAIHAGGWFDIFTQGTIDAFVGYQTRGGAGARGKQKLVIGPWSHGARGKEQGEMVFPDNATQDAIKLGDTTFTWMVHYLGIQNREEQIDAIPAVQYYTMGACGETGAPGNEWREAEEWPIPAAPTRYYLHEGGKLLTECPAADAWTDSWTYDPADPSVTVGGANLTLPAGPFDQSGAVESRSDVAVYSTEVLPAPVEVTGRTTAHLWVSVDTPDTDLNVRLTDVYPDGRSMLVTDNPLRVATRGKEDGIELLKSGEIVEAVVDVGSTSMIFNKGHRIRIIISSSNSPRFFPNPNNGEYYGTTKPLRKATVALYHDADHPSYLEAPNPDLDPAEVNACGGELDGGTDGTTADGGPTDGGTTDEGMTDEGMPGDDAHDAAGVDDGSAGTDDGGADAVPAEQSAGCSCAVVGL
ncbi:MAG: CocE/NonD family hydrolase [Deltaproteobacteria bacterium]|nr:CocE/NonD family hydrolase [Deltaproteobacteria bacterium]